MCPFCISTLGLMIAGTVSTGGLAALAMQISRKKTISNDAIANPNERNNSNVQHN